MKKMTGRALIVFLALTLVCALASCKGVNRGEGYVFLWSENANYARITISDREYIHFHRDSGVGEWVVDGESSPIKIGGIYHPIRDADAYRLTRYNTESEAELAKIFLHLDVSEDVATESFYLHNPDRKRGVIHIVHEATEKIIYASRIETSYQEHISFSFTSPQWKAFLHDDGSTVYRSQEQSFWYSPGTKTGEWNVRDKIIPIEIELLPYGPGITIYDRSNGNRKEILRASGALTDDNTLVLDLICGEMFYSHSVETLTLTKTAE